MNRFKSSQSHRLGHIKRKQMKKHMEQTCMCLNKIKCCNNTETDDDKQLRLNHIGEETQCSPLHQRHCDE